MFASKLDSCSESGSFGSDTESDIGEYDQFDEHNKNQESTRSRYEEMMNSRKIEDEAYDKRELTDKESWKSVYDNPMNISSTMGDIMGGKDFKQLEGPRRKKMIISTYLSENISGGSIKFPKGGG